MPDDERDDDFESDDDEQDSERDGEQEAERPERFFNRQEAENLLPLLQQLLATAIEKKKASEVIEQEFSRIQNRILLYGGIIPPYAHLTGPGCARPSPGQNPPGPADASTPEGPKPN